jgi:NAD(P)-dependent dehydrogenase (short-subunit alcohol dehydrogenase family)
MPVKTDGIIIMTGGSSGSVHETAFQLAKHGYQVLFGVSSSQESKAFSYYGAQKGLEFIQFNMFDPSTYPDLIYRLRLINRDLHRPIGGLIINLYDFIDKQKDEISKNLLDFKMIEENYKVTVKSPLRIIQVAFSRIFILMYFVGVLLSLFGLMLGSVGSNKDVKC